MGIVGRGGGSDYRTCFIFLLLFFLYFLFLHDIVAGDAAGGSFNAPSVSVVFLSVVSDTDADSDDCLSAAILVSSLRVS